MVLASYGTSVSEAELVQASQMDEGGLDIEALAELARQYGLRADVVHISLEDLSQLLEQEQFAIVYMNRKPLDRQFAIHAVIPIRLSAPYVTCLDPRVGRRRISRRKFELARRYLDRYAVVCGLPLT
jgi:ABC-type bacteriocin/lantibiotic exporter with double-glycine peptidase domain